MRKGAPTRLGREILWALSAVLLLVLAANLGPTAAQQPSGSDPTAQSLHYDALMREFDRLEGRITIPDEKLGVLQQPQGRDYRAFHERALPWIGGILILGMLAALAVFYATRGPVRLEPDERSGRTILRFNVFERFVHWMTATCFIVLAISGLNYFLGKRLLMPLVGPDAFSGWSQWAKYAHNFLAWPFMLGLLLMAVMWLKDNLPDRHDVAWLRAGGGFFGKSRPIAGRFNAGQKLIFWAVVLGGLALAASGIVMLFPFSLADVNGMQIAQYVHSIVGVVMIAIILAHIYIGTIGMQGAWDAMGSGEVDLGWARHHHQAWVEKLEANTRPGPGPGGASAPAE